MRRVTEISRRLSDEGVDEDVVAIETKLHEIGANLSAVWDAPCTTPRTRQRLVKALIEEIIVDVDEERSEVVMIVHWRGGQHSKLTARKPGTGEHTRRASDEAVDLIRSMAGSWPDEQIAATLNRLGYVTGTGRTWNARRVTSLRRTRNIRAYKPAADEEWVTMSGAAELLGVSNHVVRRLITTGVLPAEQVVPRAPYQIRASDLETEAVRRALNSRGTGPCRSELKTQNLRISGT